MEVREKEEWRTTPIESKGNIFSLHVLKVWEALPENREVFLLRAFLWAEGQVSVILADGGPGPQSDRILECWNGRALEGSPESGTRQSWIGGLALLLPGCVDRALCRI